MTDTLTAAPAHAADVGAELMSDSADIAAAVAKAGGPKLDKRAVVIAHPIKSVGSHSVKVKGHGEVEVNLSVDVVSA
jgi:ribosomal protein L9